MTLTETKGAICTFNDKNNGIQQTIWQQTTNKSKLATEEDVIFYNFKEELEQELQNRYPDQTIHENSTAGYDHFIITPYPVFSAPLNHDEYSKHKEFLLQNDSNRFSILDSLTKELAIHGYQVNRNNYIVSTRDFLYLVKHNPKFEAKQKDKPLIIQDLIDLSRALNKNLQQFPFKMVSTKTATGREIADILIAFNKIYGKNAHRHLEPFQKCLQLWKRNPKAATDKVDGSIGFSEFMNKETKTRPKPNKEFEKPTKKLAQLI